MNATRLFPHDASTAPATTMGQRARWMSVLLAPVAFGVLTACGGGRSLDEQLRADLLAASQAPSNRTQFASPAELGYPQGYAPAPGQYPQYAPAPYGYAAPYPAAYPAPTPYPTQPRVVYVPQRTSPVRRTSSAGAGSANGADYGTSRGPVVEERRNTQKGAIIGAATGAAIGVATARDKVKGGAIGALGGAVLGGVIGHQIKTP